MPPATVGSPAVPGPGGRIRFAAGSVRVADTNATFRRSGFGGGVPSSRRLSDVVRMRVQGRVVLVVLVDVVTVTTGPPHPVGPLLSSIPSGRTPKKRGGQPRSSAPRSGPASSKTSLTFGSASAASTAFDALARAASAGAMVVRNV